MLRNGRKLPPDWWLLMAGYFTMVAGALLWSFWVGGAGLLMAIGAVVWAWERNS